MSRGLTARGAATRQRIVEGAALLIRERGPVSNLDDMLAATSTSKSQLFHYFPNGRLDLLAAVATFEADQVLAAQQPLLSDLTTPLKWQAWRRAVIAHYAELGERCPLGALTAQLGKTSAETRRIVTRLYDTWEQYLLAGAQAMIDRGSTAADANAADIARGILTAIQGGVVMLQATGRRGYLESALAGAMRPLGAVRPGTARN